MTREDILKLAREAGFYTHKEVQPEIARFAALVAAAERAAIAALVEDMDVQHPKYIAAAIRARSEE
jgi:hypothetical protein